MTMNSEWTRCMMGLLVIKPSHTCAVWPMAGALTFPGSWRSYVWWACSPNPSMSAPHSCIKKGKRNVTRKFRHDGSADHEPSCDECGSSAWLLVMSSHTHSCNQGYGKHQEPKAHMATGRNMMIDLIHMQECYKTVLFLVSVCERGRSFITELSGGSWSHMGPENIKVGVISVFLPRIWLDVRREFSSSHEKIPAICHPDEIALLIHPLSFLQASWALFSLTITAPPPSSWLTFYKLTRSWNVLRQRVILSDCIAFVSLARSRTRPEGRTLFTRCSSLDTNQEKVSFFKC